MTAAEAAGVDLTGRSQFSGDVRTSVLPYAQTLPDFAGAYLDAPSHGELVVILTHPDKAAEEAIVSRMPAASRGLRFEYRTVAERDLKAALHKTEAGWDLVLPGIRLQRAYVDLPNGELVVEIAADDLTRVQSATALLASVLGAPVEARVAAASTDATCTTRDNCANPMKAGDRLYQGAIDNYNECTLGWEVITNSGTDGQFVTSGHCGYSGSNTWLFQGLSGNHIVGTEQATLYHNNGWDAMRVGLPDAQLGNGIYGEARQIWTAAFPIVGDTVCDSRGHSDVIDCGTVTSSDTRWYSNTAGYYVYGGATSGIAQIGGDSGSPLYERWDSSHAAAVGIVDTSGGNFTLVIDIESLLECYVYNP